MILRNLNLYHFKGNRFAITLLYVFASLSLLCCRSIDKTGNRLEGLWVGAYAHEAHRVHYPVLLELRPNGEARRIDFRRQIKDQITSWKSSDSTLTLDTTRYVLKHNTETELSLFKGYEVKFQRAQKTAGKLYESKIRQALLHKLWQTEVLREDQLITTNNYYLINNTQVILQRDYLNEGQVIDSEFEITDYQIREYNERFFLVKRGPTNEVDIRWAALEQIVEIADDHFITFKAGHFPSTVKYTFVKKMDAVDVISDREFKICYVEPIPEYFSIELKFKGGFREVKKIISENYKTPQNSENQTGYLRIRFTINCEGKPGRFNVKGYDGDLNPRYFNAEITNQLFHLTQRLVEWEMKSGEKKVDCNRFLTFKLEDGFIKEVLP